MATLFTAQPSHFWRLQSPGGTAHWIVMYGVPDGRCEALPVGRCFAQVTSPSSYQSEPRWSLTQFEVRLRLWAGHDAEGKKVEREGRAYTQIGRRVLTTNEIAHMETLIENYQKEQAHATPELPEEDSPGTEEQTGTGSAEAGAAAGTASVDGTSVAHFMAEEPQRPLRLQTPQMA